MVSHYHESRGGCELFHVWYEALKAFYKCIAEKWDPKQAMEETCVQSVEAMKKRLAATAEDVHERHAEQEREREERESDNRTLELETQNERIPSLEAELREIKAKLLDLDAEPPEREVNCSSCWLSRISRRRSRSWLS
jgi:uncharacterized protein (DUF3084 family)